MIKFKQLISNLHCDVANGLLKFNLNLPVAEKVFSDPEGNVFSLIKECSIYHIKIDFKKLDIDLFYALSSDNNIGDRTNIRAYIYALIRESILFERDIYNVVKTSNLNKEHFLGLDCIEKIADELFNTLVYIVEQSCDDKEDNTTNNNIDNNAINAQYNNFLAKSFN